MFRLKWTAVILCIVVCNLAVLDFFTVLAICPTFPVAPIQTRPLFSQMLLALEWWMGGWSSPSQSTRLVPTTCFSSLLPGWGPPVPQPDLTPPSNIEFKSFWRVGGFPLLMKTRWQLCWFWWGREANWGGWQPLMLANCWLHWSGGLSCWHWMPSLPQPNSLLTPPPAQQPTAPPKFTLLSLLLTHFDQMHSCS